MQEDIKTNGSNNSRNGRQRAGLIGAAFVGVGALLAYKLYIKPWHSIWGSSIDEVERAMPGDEIIDDPKYITTRAITIDASPTDIFPWLVQMGQGRGGAYTYDWIENMFGLNIHSADRVIPELQYLKKGDFLPMGSAGDGVVVKVFEKDHFLVFEHTDGNWTWAFGLYPIEQGRTRLVSRNRITTRRMGVAFHLYMKLVDPGAFVMERKMLLGIKERVERNSLSVPSIGGEITSQATMAVGA